MSGIISISGSSGVGKTTISNIISLILGPHKSCQISGDDLHLWERHSENWKRLTHLNPNANDLELGKLHLKLLKQGLSIDRKIYDHNTGKFLEHKKIEPKDWIIYEGLHALYGEASELADIKIFVETTDELKIDWKTRRDVNKRGYTKQQVIDAITARRQDEISYILPQKSASNVIVSYSKVNNSIEMSYVCLDERHEDMMKKIKRFYSSMSGFVGLCKKLSLEPSLVQGKGGNVSSKFHDMIIVTSSGQNIGDVNWEDGFCVCDNEKYPPTFDEDLFLKINRSSKLSGHGHPSMELSLHKSMPFNYVAHTHPIHLNSVLCSNESREVLKNIFPTLKYDYIEYTSPGLGLSLRFEPKQNVVFLENHGLIVAGNDESEVFETTLNIDNKCKEWILKNSGPYTGLKNSNCQEHLFPDSVIFTKDMAYISNQILHNIHESGLTPKFLTDEQCIYLTEMKAEKDRKEK